MSTIAYDLGAHAAYEALSLEKTAFLGGLLRAAAVPALLGGATGALTSSEGNRLSGALRGAALGGGLGLLGKGLAVGGRAYGTGKQLAQAGVNRLTPAQRLEVGQHVLSSPWIPAAGAAGGLAGGLLGRKKTPPSPLPHPSTLHGRAPTLRQ